ncbi:hypothetical protein ABN763_04725 [Spongiivirga sp. MCCC 1A20706]|uniref:hypothetical protein n=1 Tax=Spongiivirga sp. MCCC 1A20706 TaxID=3160963 RepID=UPI003977A583
MKPKHKKEQLENQIRNDLKRLGELHWRRRDLGYIELEKPIRNGWFKEAIIVREVEAYKNEDAIKEVYKILEKQVWGRTKDEANEKWLAMTSKYISNKNLPTISRKQYNRLSDAAKRLCVPFKYYNEKKKLRLRFYVNLPLGSYRIKFTRAYVTHSKRIDPLIESEIDLIWQRFLKSGFYEARERVDGWKDYWSINQKRKRRRIDEQKIRTLKQYPIHQLLNDEIEF